MRKLCVLLVCVLLFVGCGHTAISPVTVNFTCEIQGEHNAMPFAGNLQRGTVGKLSLSMTEPESLRGMQVEYDGEKVTVLLGEMRYSQESLPETAAPCVLLRILDDLFYADSADLLTVKNGEITGRIGEYVYRVQVDERAGSLLFAEISDLGFVVEFLDVRKIS